MAKAKKKKYSASVVLDHLSVYGWRRDNIQL